MKKITLILCIYLINFSFLAAETKKAYFAGGCFWCMEESYDQVEGVLSSVSGYSGGHLKNPKYEGGRSIIVGPKLEILAQDPTTDKEGIIEAEIPIAEFRRNRKIPNYTLELVEPVFSQYKQEIPINHLDMPDDQLPATGAAMKKLFDRISRYMGKTLPE